MCLICLVIDFVEVTNTPSSLFFPWLITTEPASRLSHVTVCVHWCVCVCALACVYKAVDVFYDISIVSFFLMSLFLHVHLLGFLFAVLFIHCSSFSSSKY